MRNGSVVRVSGPLAAYADDFWGYLARQGYAPSSSQDQLRLMAHVSGWLDQQGADAAGLTAERIAEFLVVRRGSHVRLVSGRALAPLLGFLRGLGVAPPEPEPVPCTTVDGLVDAYRRYLAGERAFHADCRLALLTGARVASACAAGSTRAAAAASHDERAERRGSNDRTSFHVIRPPLPG